jgi:serine/threonine protein phosphatase PrpC
VISLRWGSTTDTGLVRTNNEDVALAEEALFAVADGMGGHAAGEVASSVAVKALRAAAAEGLPAAVLAANRAVLELAESDPALRGMGTTLCALTLNHPGGHDEVEIVNVGDSRGYLFRDGELIQVTDDHNVPAELEREGRLTRAEAKVHPQRNIVTRILGNSPEVVVDRFTVDPFRGDRFVLCSDGLFDEVDDEVIAEVLRRVPDAQAATAELVAEARAAGGRDNITVVVVDVVDDGGTSASASREVTESGAGRPVATAVEAPDAPPAAATTTALAPAAHPTAVVPAVPAPRRARRLTWRSVAFTLAVLVVLGGVAGSIWWFGRGSYYVGLDGGEVTIFRGRPGGLLWLDPTVEQRTGLHLDDLSDDRRPAVQEGKPEPTLGDAKAYVDRLRATGDDTAGSSTTTTTASTTTTSAVVVPTTAVGPA